MPAVGFDPITGTVRIPIFLARESRQREFDKQYGPGAVTLYGSWNRSTDGITVGTVDGAGASH